MRRSLPSLFPLVLVAAACGGSSGVDQGGEAAPGGGDAQPAGGEAPEGAADAGGNGDAGTDARAIDGAAAPASLLFGPYKDTGIAMNWNTNVVSTAVSGSMRPLGVDLAQAGARTVSLAFATGECGSENWAGLPGDTIASVNVPLLEQSGVRYVVSTGGAGGSFTCASDAGMSTFLARWASPSLVGIDFDIEAGQSRAVIGDLVARIHAAHASSPALRFSLTLATLAANAGASRAQSLGASAPDGLNTYGDMSMAAVQSVLGASPADPATWPAYLTINLMAMDYGAPSPGVCVVQGGACQMGESAVQAAYDLHDKWGVPYTNIELTPMIGGNDETSERFTLADADTVAAFALAQKVAGVHYWSYDRDVDCPLGAASSTCNSMGSGYAGERGYLTRWLAAGLR
jgi:chitinase